MGVTMFLILLVLLRCPAESQTAKVSPVPETDLVSAREDLILVKEIESPPNDPSHLWNRVSSMDVKKDCSVLALFNTKPPRISILDARTLDLVTTFGKKGRGPGEFRDFSAWIGFKDDTLFVSQSHTTSLFLGNGTYLDMDIRTFRTSISILSQDQTTSIDQNGNIYYWNGRPKSEYLILKKMRDGKEEFFVRSSELPSQSALQAEKRDIYCRVIKDGSIIVALAREPIVARFTPTGSRLWLVDLSKIPVISRSYKEVQAGKILALYSSFWVDSMYVIVTVPEKEIKVGKPAVYYVFLDALTGKLVRLAYAAQNIARSQPGKDEFHEALLYNPWEIAHCNGRLYVFAENSARLLMYRLAWHK
jgi:hypothetical protein